jgi:hypothetical protein
LDKEKPTKSKIKAVIIKVVRWKSLADVLRSDANVEKMATMDAALAQLMFGLGAKVEAATPPSATSKCDVH